MVAIPTTCPPVRWLQVTAQCWLPVLLTISGQFWAQPVTCGYQVQGATLGTAWGGLSRFPTTLYLAAHRITCPAVHLLVQTFKTAFLTPKKTKGAGKMKGSPVWTERHYQNPCLHPSHSPYYPQGNISTPVPCHLSSCEDEERLEREREGRGWGAEC